MRLENKNIAVLGGGAIAMATATELFTCGFGVNLFELPAFGINVQHIKERGGIEFSGKLGRGLAKLNIVTTNAEEALKNVGLIILAAPAFSHHTFFEACMPHLKDGQVFLIETAYFGCLRFAKEIKNVGKRVIMAEMNITPYTCTKTGPAQIYIDAKRGKMLVSAFPANEVKYVSDIIKDMYPGIIQAQNVLRTSLDNINWIAHPPITLLHRGLIERSKNFTLPLKDSIPNSVFRLMETMDSERQRLGNAFGLELPPIMSFYDQGGETLEEALRRSQEFETFKFEYKNCSNQYLKEDLYCALPLIISLANIAQVPTPVINAVMHIFSVIDGVDYKSDGLNVENIGLSGFTIEEIIRLVEEGH